MNGFIGTGRALFIAAVAVGAVWLVGCGGENNPSDNGGTIQGVLSGDILTYGGQAYYTVVIGGKRWMAENSNYKTSSGSWCYENADFNCDMFGRLYEWETANKICPKGWRLPYREDWDNLAEAVGGEKASSYGAFHNWLLAGKKLKAAGDFWDGNGTDDYGFSALPSGARDEDGEFDGIETYAEWWTATWFTNAGAYRWMMTSTGDWIGEGSDFRLKSYGFSVRCIQN